MNSSNGAILLAAFKKLLDRTNNQNDMIENEILSVLNHYLKEIFSNRNEIHSSDNK